jgi:hypothetical protein
MFDIKQSNEYQAIKKFYGDRRAERSQVLLMDHIDQGLRILQAINADKFVQQAYCLHPLFQADADLATRGLLFTLDEGEGADPYVILLVMEYRQWANAWLSDKVGCTAGVIHYSGKPTAGPLIEVKQMLIADKVQNYKDFLTYHKVTHERSKELDHYFRHWLKVLEVDETQFVQLCQDLDIAQDAALHQPNDQPSREG